MRAPATFGVFQIQSNGSFKRDRLDASADLESD